MSILWLIEGIRNPFLDFVFSWITKLGEETLAVIILCAIFWCIDKRLAYAIGVTYFISGLFVQGMKINFRIDRPWIIDPGFIPVASAVEHATGYSFPSGHTQSAAALFGVLGFYLKKSWQRISCFTVVFLVGFSRMYLGVHTLLDVGVSVVFSLIIAYFTVRLLTGEEKTSSGSGWVLPSALLAAAAGVGAMAFLLYSAGNIDEGYVSDCVKAAFAGAGFAAGMYIERKYINFSASGGTIIMRIVRYLPGIAGVLAIKEGLKLVIGTGLAADASRYFLLCFWITALFPLIISKWFKPKENKEVQ